uniref:Uncharacterized protein n=1 Tax=Anguilla anguilla TaxID=7936 RepID=A0A0E9TCI8_ANGAN
MQTFHNIFCSAYFSS